MAAQRRHNRRRKARGRFRGLYRLLSIFLILAAVTAACIVFFRVQTVRVEGCIRYTSQDVIRVSGIKAGDYLALLDQARISRQIRAELPYIERASVRRSLPDTVVITVEESLAAAALQFQDQWWLVNSAGKLLEPVTEARLGSYPVISGVELLTPAAGISAVVAEEDENRWGCALALLTALEERGELSKLNSLDCGEGTTFSVRYSEQYTLLLPTTIAYEPITAEQFRYFFSLLDGAMPELLESGRDLVDFTSWEATGRIFARHSK